MFRLWACSMMAGLSLLAGSCTTAQKPPVAQKADSTVVAAAVDSINRAFTAAVAARDTDAVANFYATDARLLPPNAPRANGRDGVRAAWAQFLSTPGLELNLVSGEVIPSNSGDLAVDVGTYTMKSAGKKKGTSVEDVGKYVTVLRNVGGEWKIVVDTFNSDKAPPAQ